MMFAFAKTLLVQGAPPVSSGLARTRHCARAVSIALCGVVFWSASSQAQSLGVHVSARAGLGIPDDAYSSSCGEANMAFSLDVEGRRTVFPQVSLDYFTGPNGGDCVFMDPSTGTKIGGLRVEGSTRLGLGVGARLGAGNAQLEGVVSTGIISGRRGFASPGAEDDSRHIMPHVGGQASLVLLRYVVFSAGINWTRLSFDLIPPAGAPVTTQTSWEPLTTMQVGVRLPAKR